MHCIHFISCINSPNTFSSAPSPTIFAFRLLLGRTVCSPTTHVPGWQVAIKANHRHNATVCSPQFVALHREIGELAVPLTGLEARASHKYLTINTHTQWLSVYPLSSKYRRLSNNANYNFLTQFCNRWSQQTIRDSDKILVYPCSRTTQPRLHHYTVIRLADVVTRLFFYPLYWEQDRPLGPQIVLLVSTLTSFHTRTSRIEVLQWQANKMFRQRWMRWTVRDITYRRKSWLIKVI